MAKVTKPSKQKPSPKILVHVWLRPEVVARVDRFAEEEERTRANMLAVLVNEAVNARK